MMLWDYISTQAAILQLENYEAKRWWSWWRHHPFTVLRNNRKKVVWTKRLIATMLLTPWVMSGVNQMYVWNVKRKIKSSLSGKKLTKIAITGSFGKTTVKEFLYTILDTAGYALTTPGSFNTFGGILRVLKKELTPVHDYFVVELGAYHMGDIRELGEVIQPDFGVLTALGPQHLERFGSMEAITTTKFELMAVSPKGKFLVNWDDPRIREHIQKHNLLDRVIRVSKTDSSCEYFIQRFSMNEAGIELEIHNQVFIAPHLFGSVMVDNLMLAIATALELGVSVSKINQSMQFIYPPLHRLEMSKLYKASILDNTYSSNITGFTKVLEDIASQKGTKALVTPGVVELGNKEEEIHFDLGIKAAAVVNEVVLVRETNRTKAFAKGLKAGKFKGSVRFIPLHTQTYWQTVTELAKIHDWVVLENDISEQYV